MIIPLERVYIWKENPKFDFDVLVNTAWMLSIGEIQSLGKWCNAVRMHKCMNACIKFIGSFCFFPFYLLIFSTTPSKNESALSECTRDASLVCIYFYSLLFCLLFYLRTQCDIHCFKFMEKTKRCLLNEKQSRIQQNLETMSISPSSTSYQGNIMYKKI